jgi:hypothetical protein
MTACVSILIHMFQLLIYLHQRKAARLTFDTDSALSPIPFIVKPHPQTLYRRLSTQ